MSHPSALSDVTGPRNSNQSRFQSRLFHVFIGTSSSTLPLARSPCVAIVGMAAAELSTLDLVIAMGIEFDKAGTVSAVAVISALAFVFSTPSLHVTAAVAIPIATTTKAPAERSSARYLLRSASHAASRIDPTSVRRKSFPLVRASTAWDRRMDLEWDDSSACPSASARPEKADAAFRYLRDSTAWATLFFTELSETACGPGTYGSTSLD
ncbi:uncharacterized protein K489DRAFT_379148 [Dissoconium aciculare CBS 342.82]|uniref:Uncharacterized protein n=1 Tax=Dissoconium aciculare CBS 342.82 TaxID=1314786 RepID=A0A6J3MA37_9PEZI|nr:uncharacterized protein K489DRAFT_379148 [Dissoconium aciculare CBS 342.82]KAF1824713.1 hypothetical protein K489DRAFT_379148 [Dissoconium aciculare CBS 342.82]